MSLFLATLLFLVPCQESFHNLFGSDFGDRGSAEIDANFEYVSEIERDAGHHKDDPNKSGNFADRARGALDPQTTLTRKVEAFLLLDDAQSAIVEGKKVLQKAPEVPSHHEMLLKSLSRAGEEEEMMEVWERFETLFPGEAIKDEVLEEICWGILRKGSKSSKLPTRLITLIGAALTQDVYAVKMLKENIDDPSSLLRRVAVELAAHFGDEELKTEIVHRFHKESVWMVREELYHAIGELKITSLLPELIEQVRSKKVGRDEKRAAIVALASVLERPTHEQIEHLAASSWAPLRVLACKLIVEHSLKEESPLLLSLCNDSHREVKQEALGALGWLRLPLPEEMKGRVFSQDPFLAVIASWVQLLSCPEEGEKTFRPWIFHEREEVRLFAAGALAQAGSAGALCADGVLAEVTDPLVKANLACALLKQRRSVQEASEILYTFLREYKGQLMMGEGRFAVFQKSTLLHDPLIPNYPEVMNQIVRLELLNLLAIVEYPLAAQAIREFLKERHWEVVGVAAETLLTEGDESAIALVQKLLEDPDAKIRLESALLLAVWGREKKALPYLLEAYPQADREMKIKILESLGRLGERETIPFLVKQLKDPSQLFRLIAASILLQTLKS